MNKYPNLVLTLKGPAGTGKTIVLKQIEKVLTDFGLVTHKSKVEHQLLIERPLPALLRELVKSETVKVIKCQVCGYKTALKESDVEGYYCPNCGSSDSDE